MHDEISLDHSLVAKLLKEELNEANWKAVQYQALAQQLHQKIQELTSQLEEFTNPADIPGE